jgi:5,5'-dehydrodivanillate O-demethylase oxygenase subunit
LGESLALFRDRRGELGLLSDACAECRMPLSRGTPEKKGLRCVCGWRYGPRGRGLEQAAESPEVTRPVPVFVQSYPAKEMGGLIFAYMGPEPAPLLPRYDVLAWDGYRDHWSVMLPCNWLQCQENSLDPVHYEWLHRYWGSYQINRQKSEEERAAWDRWTVAKGRHHVKVGFDRFKYGVIKRRLLDGENEEDEWWRVGHPILFPNVLRVGRDRWHAFQYRIPVDDTHTLHLTYTVRIPEPGQVVKQDVVPFTEVPLYNENGRVKDDYVIGQDQLAWVIQGAISDRPTEHLGVTDVGLIMFRRMLDEQMKIVEDGGDPLNVHREQKDIIVLPTEFTYYPGETETGGPFKDLKPQRVDLERTLQ